MKLTTIIRQIRNGQFTLMLKLIKMSNQFYKASFISTAISQGIYDKFVDGKSSFEMLCKKIGVTANQEGLFAWLELGVSLGELKRVGNDYEIKGILSKALLEPKNDAYKALVEEIVKHHYSMIVNAPKTLKEQKMFPFDETLGELIARSSRIAEPYIFEAVDENIPLKGEFHLLEVGCGTGVYIKRACEINADLSAVGIDLQKEVADFAQKNIVSWGLENKVNIKHCDVKNFQSNQKFDLITLHQNIYYFPVAERINLFSHLISYLQQGGELLLTTIGQGGGPGFQALNIWCSTSDGYGPLPHPDQLCKQLKDAGFVRVKKKRLIPFESFWEIVATKAK
jgi:4-hydroxy-2,2'-bipyrrole-5-carbaldehyde O-methyltransferase